jgi:hypothetical protein
MAVDIHDTHKDRHGCRNVECKPRPMRSLELVSDLPQDLGGMDRRSFYEHELVAGPLESHRKQALADYHEHADEDLVARRLHAPAQDEGSCACHPGEEPEGREEVARSPNGHELQADFERPRGSWKTLGYTMKVSITRAPRRVIITHSYAKMIRNVIRCLISGMSPPVACAVHLRRYG